MTAEQTQKLPPLILHPFSDSASPEKLVQGSRASLMLQGILPQEDLSFIELEEILLEGRVCEIRMLYYVGKDLLRWIEQCVECTGSAEMEQNSSGVEPQTFAALLIDEAPIAVREKLRAWGVQDYKSIFARALGLNAIFADAPSKGQLAGEFIRNYHQYSDQMYTTWQRSQAYAKAAPDSFDFDLYASAEYSRMLERQWSEE
ncbi:MAG: hypothetical protein H7Y20_04425 [Bryobacteraceae bacterium]|nr:hypothetical protein [Bryobacteraceae bacterium]